MEQTRKFEHRLNSLKKAISTFNVSLGVDLSRYEGIELDTFKSGQIQKFEVCVELFWKTMKSFLFEIHGINAVSPKMTLKELYVTN